MIRKLLVLLTAGALALGWAAPASAHIAAFNWSTYYIGFDTDNSGATGTITCTAGETFQVTVRVQQKTPGYRGAGSTSGTCTGSSQNWSAPSTSTSGDAVFGSKTRWIMVATSFQGGVFHDQARIVTYSA